MAQIDYCSPFSLEMKRTVRRWQFPQHRFVEYEPSDEAWCRYCGIGKEVDVIETVTIPKAVVRSISPNIETDNFGIAEAGVTVEFVALPDAVMEFIRA